MATTATAAAAPASRIEPGAVTARATGGDQNRSRKLRDATVGPQKLLITAANTESMLSGSVAS